MESLRNKGVSALFERVVARLKLPDALACRAQFLDGKALRK